MQTLSSLPPTTEAFTENVKRAHLQTWIWRKALDLNPNVPDLTNYGYTKEGKTKSLLPVQFLHKYSHPEEAYELAE